MLTPEQRHELINKIRRFPSELEVVVRNLTEEQLITQTIPGEWTVAQNVHHLADSHMNAFIRTKLLLTENSPTVKPYHQDSWAAMIEASDEAIETSLSILHGLHRRWVKLFESLSEADWARGGTHPEHGAISIEDLLQTYARHGEGHIDQISRTLAAGR